MGRKRIEVAPLSEKELALWDDLVRRSPQGTPFNTSTWFRIMEEAFGRKWVVYGAAKKGNLVGGCASLATKRMGLRLFLPQVLSPYQGLVCAGSESPRVCERVGETLRQVEALEEDLRKRHAFLWLVHHPEMVELRPFVWNRWETVPRYTFRVAALPAGEALGTFRYDIRRRIAKAEEAGLVVSRRDDLRDLIHLWAGSYGRHGLASPVPPEGLARWYGLLAAEGMARAYAASGPDGRVHAFRIVLRGERTAYDWVAGADRELLSSGGSPFLVWKILDDIHRDADHLDFLGANTRSIAAFKTGFGGTPVMYWETRWYRSLPVRALFEGKRMLQRLRKR